jgi:hypothetical protein
MEKENKEIKKLKETLTIEKNVIVLFSIFSLMAILFLSLGTIKGNISTIVMSIYFCVVCFTVVGFVAYDFIATKRCFNAKMEEYILILCEKTQEELSKTSRNRLEKIKKEQKLEEKEQKMDNFDIKIYNNLKFRDEIIKNPYGKIKDKQLKEDFLKEIIAKETISIEKVIKYTIEDAIKMVKDYDFRLKELYYVKLAEFEQTQALLDKYAKKQKDGE